MIVLLNFELSSYFYYMKLWDLYMGLPDGKDYI